MSTTKNLKFFHLGTDASMAASGLEAGAIYFEPKTGRIHVATSETTSEPYGGGRISDATYEGKKLVIKFNDGTEAINLDFSDVASAGGVSSLLSGLRDDVNALKKALDGEEGKPGINSRVSTLESDLNDAAGDIDALEGRADALEGRADALEELVGSTSVASQIFAATGDLSGVTVKDYVDTAIDGVNNAIDEVNNDAEALADRVDALEATVNTENTGLKDRMDTAENDIDALEGRATTIETAIGGENSGLIKADADNKKAIEDEAKRASDAEKALADRLNVIEGGETVDGSVAKALKDAKDYTDSKIDDVNTAAGDLKDRMTAAEGKISTLIGDDTDASKSVRTIANEELAKQLIPEDAIESLDTLQEIAAWIQAHPGDASEMNNDISALKTAVGDAESGLVKGLADANASINVNTSAISTEKTRAEDIEGGLRTDVNALKGLVGETSVASQISAGIDGISEASKSNTAGSDVVVTVTTKAGSVSAVAVDASVLDGKVSSNTSAISTEKTRAEGVEEGLRNDLGEASAEAGTGTAFARIKSLEAAQAAGSLMWANWD